MLILITYDVNTETSAGRSRLRKVAKQCVNYGQRVQNSVFECQVDAVKYREIKAVLEKIVDKDTDSLRFYNLGDTELIADSLPNSELKIVDGEDHGSYIQDSDIMGKLLIDFLQEHDY